VGFKTVFDGNERLPESASLLPQKLSDRPAKLKRRQQSIVILAL
jgi:hypothetical protein